MLIVGISRDTGPAPKTKSDRALCVNDPLPHFKMFAKVDSADDLRASTVASAKRLAVIHSSLKAKFLLHLQGGQRVERTGNRVIGETVRTHAAVPTKLQYLLVCLHPPPPPSPRLTHHIHHTLGQGNNCLMSIVTHTCRP